MTAPIATAESLVSQSDDAFAADFGIPPAPAPTEAEVPAVVPPVVVPAVDPAAPVVEPVVEVPAVDPAAPVVDPNAPVVDPAKPADEARKPITVFKVLDAEGELEIPDVMIEYKANGEMLKESLDKVVRRAQMGGYNEALVREKDTLKVAAAELQTSVTQHEERLSAREAQIERLLTDDDYLQKARDAFAEYNDPSARADRTARELREVREREGQTARETAIKGFVEDRVLPVYTSLVTANPHVSADEIWGRFARLTAPLQVRGEIPRDKWPQVEALLSEDIGPWVAQLQEHRASTARDTSKVTDTTVRKAQEDAQKARNQLARAVKPAGGTPATTPQAKPIVSADDAVADIINSIGK